MTEHEAMLEAFCKDHGDGREYKTREEHDQWLGWLGCFTLGWNAHRKYVGIAVPTWVLIFSGMLIGNVVMALAVMITRAVIQP